MSKQEEIEALRKEVEKKERQLYRANREMHAWNKGRAKSHANAEMSKLFVKSLEKEIAEHRSQLRNLKGKD
jgi:predicted  nucleic acid-binding Zn-ribbon protein